MSAPPGTPTRSDRAGSGVEPPSPRELAPAEPARDAADLALCRSVLWEALALGFRPPTRETIARLASRNGAWALADAASVLDRAGETVLVPLALALEARPVASLGTLEAAYGRLFGHTARGLVPPYETEYGEDSLWAPPREMSDLGAFFRAFGLVLRPDARERPDHVGCECEFMAVLARREAHALEIGDATMAEVTARAARLFLRHHLGRWAPAFGAKLAREDPHGFFGRLGRLCAAFVTAECRRAGVPAGPSFLRLRSAAAGDAPIGCGPLPGASRE